MTIPWGSCGEPGREPGIQSNIGRREVAGGVQSVDRADVLSDLLHARVCKLAIIFHAEIQAVPLLYSVTGNDNPFLHCGIPSGVHCVLDLDVVNLGHDAGRRLHDVERIQAKNMHGRVAHTVGIPIRLEGNCARPWPDGGDQWGEEEPDGSFGPGEMDAAL